MKTNKLIATLLATAALAAGCQESQEYTDVVYFTGTEDTPVTSMYVDGPSAMGITVTSSRKVAADIDVALAVDPTAVDGYNAANGTAYKMLPDGCYRLSKQYATISAGNYVSEAVKFEITSMDDFEEGALYCCPLKILSTSDGTGILAASQTQYIIINQITSTRGVDLQSSYYFSMPAMVGDSDLSDMGVCTMEIRVMAKSFPAETANPGIQSVIGVEENFLLRFGDISCLKNQLQVAGRGVSVTSNTLFNTNQWYHIAVVDDGSTLSLYVDGELDTSIDSSGKSAINLAWDYMDGFHIGRSERARLLNGCVSEARIWRRALTGIELKNNQCYVDPTSEGLVAYWRLDETQADGKTIRDLTGHGYDAVASNGSVAWTDIKCPVVD